MAGGIFTLVLLSTCLAYSYGSPLTYEEFQDIRSQCPRYNGRFSVYIPHPRDCEEFFQCDNGRPMAIRCPQTLHFNPTSKICDYKERAGCTALTEPETVKSITGSQGGQNRPKPYVPTMKVDRRCKGTRSDVTVFLPHETNCERYYVCNSDYAVHMFCPQGLQFNLDRKLCDYPQNVHCPQKVRARAPAGPASLPLEGEGAKPESEQPAPIGKKDPRCPLRQGPLPIFLNHESNCGLYYVCDSGLAILMNCPHHLLFNIDKRVCDHPHNVECSSQTEDKPTEDQHEENVDENPAMNEEPLARKERVADDDQPSASIFSDERQEAAPAGAPYMKKDPRCPKFNSVTPIFLPHETYCGKYYVCDWGYAILMGCPPTLAFNPDTNTCSLPRDC